MNKRTSILHFVLIATLIIVAGCATGSRQQHDKTAEFADNMGKGGTEISGPEINFWDRLAVQLFNVRTHAKNTAKEDGNVDAGSIASETALQNFAASTESQRGTNQQKRVQYGLGSLATKAQADVVREFMLPFSDTVKAYLATLGGPIAAIAGNAGMTREAKLEAIKPLIPNDAPGDVKAAIGIQQ